MAWQFVAIITATVLTATLTTLAATGWATAFRTWAAGCGTTLAVGPVVKARVAALGWTTTAFSVAVTATIAATFAATIALAFKARCALWAVAA